MNVNKILFKKIFFTFFIVFVFILGKNILLPMLETNYNLNSNVDNFILGESKGISIFALGISPWMSSMIIWRAVSALKLFNSHEFTQKKSNRWQNILMLFIAIIQGTVLLIGENFKNNLSYSYRLVFLFLLLILIAGAFLTMWLANMNAQFGIGGMVVIIIITFIHSYSIEIFNYLLHKDKITVQYSFKLIIVLLVFSFLSLILGIILELAEYRIPLIRIMLNNKFSKESYIPIKLNSSGGMAFMYAMPLMILPQYIVTGLKYYFPNNDSLIWLSHNLSMFKPLGMSIYLLLLAVLSIAFTFINVDIERIVNILKKSGDFIEGCSPGYGTEKYLYKKVKKIAVLGAFYVLLVAGIPLTLVFYDPSALRLFMLPGIIMMTTSIVLTASKELDILKITKKYNKSLF